MPYQLVPCNSGFRVQSDRGHFLSKKCLPKKKARAQQIAVSISEGLYKIKPKRKNKK